MKLIRDIYFLNYIKTKSFVSRLYKDKEYKHHYAALLMLSKISVAIIFPIFRLLDYFDLRYLLVKNKIYYFIAYGVFFILDYFFVEKKFSKIEKEYKKKSIKDIKKVKFFTKLLFVFMLFLNLYFILFFNR